MTKRCCICGCEFETKPKGARATVCSDLCRKLNRQAYMSAYQPKRREYNRLWMQRYRDALGKDEVNRRQKEARLRRKNVNTFEGKNYAERQMARTLAIAGKVQI